MTSHVAHNGYQKVCHMQVSLTTATKKSTGITHRSQSLPKGLQISHIARIHYPKVCGIHVLLTIATKKSTTITYRSQPLPKSLPSRTSLPFTTKKSATSTHRSQPQPKSLRNHLSLANATKKSAQSHIAHSGHQKVCKITYCSQASPKSLQKAGSLNLTILSPAPPPILPSPPNGTHLLMSREC